MKKLIAISVVFALVAGVAFAVDLSAGVTARVKLFEGSSAGGGVSATGFIDGLRLEGSAELADGKFGGVIRFNGKEFPLSVDKDDKTGALKDVNTNYPGPWDAMVVGFAWWKPIDQFKLILGQSNAVDGFWGKEGNSGWGFNKRPTNSPDITESGGFVWGGHYNGLNYRKVFAEAFDQKLGLYMEIKPLDLLGINIGFDFRNGVKWDGDVFKNNTEIQIDLNLAFGNIALTYVGDNMFLYYGGSFGPIALDVGLSMLGLTAGSPNYINFGAAVEYTAGAFGVRVRTAEGIPVKGGLPFLLNFGVLPFFKINDNMTAFLFAEIGMATKGGPFGFVINPYMKIGEDWGPAFYVGFRVERAPLVDDKTGAISYPGVTFALPIAITVGF